VRTKEGYGARWTISKEGAVEFRGFIEPVRTPLPHTSQPMFMNQASSHQPVVVRVKQQMEDGHDKKWRH